MTAFKKLGALRKRRLSRRERNICSWPARFGSVMARFGSTDSAASEDDGPTGPSEGDESYLHCPSFSLLWAPEPGQILPADGTGREIDRGHESQPVRYNEGCEGPRRRRKSNS